MDGDELMEPIEGRVEISLRYSNVILTVIGDKQPKQQRSRGNQRFGRTSGSVVLMLICSLPVNE